MESILVKYKLNAHMQHTVDHSRTIFMYYVYGRCIKWHSNQHTLTHNTTLPICLFMQMISQLINLQNICRHLRDIRFCIIINFMAVYCAAKHTLEQNRTEQHMSSHDANFRIGSERTTENKKPPLFNRLVVTSF